MTSPVTNPITPPPSPEVEIPGDGAIKSGAKRTPKQPEPPEQPREYVGLHSWYWSETIKTEGWRYGVRVFSAIFLGVVPFLFLFDLIFHRGLSHGILKAKKCTVCTTLNPDGTKQKKSKKETDKSEKSDKSKTDQEKTKTKKRHRGTLPELDGIPPPSLPEPKKAVEKSEDGTKTEDTPGPTEEDLAKKLQKSANSQKWYKNPKVYKSLGIQMVVAGAFLGLVKWDPYNLMSRVVLPAAIALPVLYQLSQVYRQSPDKKQALKKIGKGVVALGAVNVAIYGITYLVPTVGTVLTMAGTVYGVYQAGKATIQQASQSGGDEVDPEPSSVDHTAPTDDEFDFSNFPMN